MDKLTPDDKTAARNRALLTGAGILGAALAVHHFWPKGIIYGDPDDAWSGKKDAQSQSQPQSQSQSQQQDRPRRRQQDDYTSRRSSRHYPDNDDDHAAAAAQPRRTKSVNTHSYTYPDDASRARAYIASSRDYSGQSQSRSRSREPPVAQRGFAAVEAAPRRSSKRFYDYEDGGSGSGSSGSGAGGSGSTARGYIEDYYNRDGYQVQRRVEYRRPVVQPSPPSQQQQQQQQPWGREGSNRRRIEYGFDR